MVQTGGNVWSTCVTAPVGLRSEQFTFENGRELIYEGASPDSEQR